MSDPTPEEANEAMRLIMRSSFGIEPNAILMLSIERLLKFDLGVRHVLCRYVDGSVIADVFPHNSTAFRLTYAAATVLA